MLLLISELTHYGVDDAQLLVDRHGVERCRQQLAAMPARITEYARRGRPIANPPGYLRLAIERGYRIPDAVATAAVREKVAAQQRQREAAELEDAQYRAAADKILAELAPATMARFRARAEEQIRAMNPIMRRAPKIPDGLMRSQLVKIVAGAM